MFLKSLIIQGFKSFPERTVIEFHSGVTAVVGPNGSGKSNITDAILWVLGEQSIRALRGEKMEDVIFSGTQNRKAMGFAEVSLILDNKSHLLPIDYQEVQITRRLYRSGESEYLINQNNCRLKDILNLFMDTGLGKNGYSIIGQGKIDEVLSNRAEDRRRIFEEAAGIVKFKTQKHEAERKLAIVDQNLLRIEENLSDLGSRLNPLKKQAEKAKQFIQLSEQLKENDINYTLHQVQSNENKMSVLKENLDLLKADLAAEEKQVDELKHDYQSSEAKLEKFDQDLEVVRKDTDELNVEYSKTVKEQALFREKIKHNKQQLLQNYAEKELLLEKLEGLKKDLSHGKEGFLQLKAELATKQLKLTEAEQKYQTSVEAVQKNQQLTEKELQTLATAQKLILQLEKEEIVIAGEQNQVKQNQKNFKEQGNSFKNTQTQLETQSLEKKQALADVTSKLSAAQEKIAALKIEHAEKATSYTKKQQEFAMLQQSLRDDQGKFELLRKLEESYQGYHDAVKSVMLEAKVNQKFKKGVIGPVAEQIQTKEKFELAIEIALGASLHHIITQDGDTAAEVIAWLKSTQAGRATFLPLDGIQARPIATAIIQKAKEVEGFIANAAEVVSFDEKLQQVVQQLLGQVLIAKDLVAARKLAKHLKSHIKIVTLEGEIIFPSGAMQGGYSKKRPAKILSRSREIERLEKSLQDTKKIIAAKEKDLTNLQAELQNIIDLIKVQEKIYTIADLEQNNFKQLIEDLQQELKLVAEKQLQTAEMLEKLEAKDVALKQQAASLKQKISALEKEIAIQHDTISQEHKNRANLQEHNEQLRELILQCKLETQATEEKIKSHQTLAERIQYEENEYQARLEKLQQEIKEIETSMTHKDENLEAFSNQENEMEVMLKENQTRADAIYKARTALEQTLKSYFEMLGECSERIAAMNAEISKQEALESRYLQQDEALKNMLWENYNISYVAALEREKKVEDYRKLGDLVQALKQQIKQIGPVNTGAVDEYHELKSRHEFILQQETDIKLSRKQLNKVIQNLNKSMETIFLEKFEIINENFKQVFTELFNGGQAEITLDNQEEILTCGVEIMAQPPGKKLQSLSLLSGGERCLTAIALLFAILQLQATPFCVLDEVEASLDDVNIMHFSNFINRYIEKTQFIIVTHSQGTMETAHRIYGITMQEKGVSKVVSAKLQ